MKNLTPETRAKVEAMMKQQGVAIGSGGVNRVCLSKESLDTGRWQARPNCKTDFGSRSGQLLEMAFGLRRRPTPTIDGEADLRQPRELHRPDRRRRGPFAATPRSRERRCSAKWLGADCGDLKPFDPKR